MVEMTLHDGRQIQRVFAGFVTSDADLENAVRELREEHKANRTGRPLLVELWADVSPKVKHRKKLLPSQEEEFAVCK